MNREEFRQEFGRLREQFATPVQDEEEFWSLFALLQGRQVSEILEIGAEKGGTLWFWDKVAGPGGRVVSVDTCDNVFFDLEEGISDVSLIVGDSHAPEDIDRIMNLFPEGVDFLFIDGDHSYEGVKADFDNFSPLVRPGGIIAFHDIGAGDPQKLWREIEPRHSTAKYHCTIGIGVIFT